MPIQILCRIVKVKFYGGTYAFWYVSLNPLNEYSTVELMPQREENRKKTREDVARLIQQIAGITFKEAEKLVIPEVWGFEKKYLQYQEGVRSPRNYYRWKPWDMLKDPSKDKHYWRGTKELISTREGIPPLASQLPMAQSSIDETFEEFKTVPKPEPSFNDSDHPLESGKQKYEEVKALKEKWPTKNRVLPLMEHPLNDHYWLNKKIRERWIIEAKNPVALWREDLLTRDWNSLPKGCPFYEIRNIEFFRLFNDFNPILMSICDMQGSLEGSLIASQMELEKAFDWFHPTPRMKELMTDFKRWIDEGDCPPDYETDFIRTKHEVRRRIEAFKKEPTLPQLAIMAFLHLMYRCLDQGVVTIRDLKPYLMEKYPDRFPESKYGKSNSGTKNRWKSVFRDVRNWIPLGTAFEQDYKNRKPRGTADNDNLFDSAPSNVPDLS